MRKLNSIRDVVDWRLCLGCGACAYICPQKKIGLVDVVAEGIRPVLEGTDCGSCRQCLEVCPGVQSDFTNPGPPDASRSEDSFTKEWGPVVAIWEGYASDSETRAKGSSGGALTALGAYCLEILGMHGVLHIAQDPDDPVRNRTRLSRTRDQLLAATGSRYSPASVCNGLGLVEAAPAPCAVIGKPSEIAAICNARKMRPQLDRNIGLTMSFFCAETPATAGTVALLKKMGVEPEAIGDLRYRGNGWPGHFAPTRRGEMKPANQMSYRESWAFLQAYRPWVVQLWPDGSGELADISCGDPWYEEPDGKNPGFSLVVARTERGRRIVEGAISAGYLALTPAEEWKLARSQPGLLQKKGSVWGRRLAMRLLGLPVTSLPGAALKHCWRPLGIGEKLRAILGTIRRVITRKIYRRVKLDISNAKPVGTPIDLAHDDKCPKKGVAGVATCDEGRSLSVI